MPIYEEKLISPLAIRFTQQRIRETFQDGYEVEATIKQITAAPGVGDYDIILEVPFPAIEIIRWAANGRSSGSGENWFSFDNRRLYCLQRVAAKYWPKRVGASVEVLYADSGAIRKKLDTQTCGMSVSIGHAFSVAHELAEWSWRKAVQKRGLPASRTCHAENVIAADDAKTNVSELNDAPVLSSFERLARAEERQNNPILPEEVVSEEEKEEQVQVTPEKKLAGQGELLSTGDSPPPKDNSLTALIGQLLVLKTSEGGKCKESSNDDASSTHLSEQTETADSTGSSPSAASSDPKVASGGEEEDSVQQEPLDPVSAEQPVAKKTTKEPRTTKATMSSKRAQRAAWEAQAVQYQMAAQCQMAQWQQAQYMQAAQYAHWQHASLAAAQFQAAQHGYF